MMEDLGFSAQDAFPRRMTMNKRGCEATWTQDHMYRHVE